MMKKGRLAACALACSAILATTSAPPAAAQSGAPAAPAASSPAASSPAAASSATAGAGTELTIRPEIGVLLQEAQRLLVEKRSKEAADKLAGAEALADKTPYELYILARVKVALAVAEADAAVAAEQFQLASQGPWMKPADKVATLQVIAGLYYNAKNYAKAIEWTARYHQAGGDDPGVNILLAQSYYLSADYANAARVLDAEVGKATASGQKPVERQLLLLADARGRLRDDAGQTRTLETLIQHYPSKDNWRTLLARLWAKPQLAARMQLEVFRLQLASVGFTAATDYSQMAELALQEGSAIEAGKVLEQGYAAGLPGSADKAGELKRLGDKIAKSAAEDRATLEKDVVRAKALPDGLAMFNYGFNLFQLGQTERGLAQMEQGLAKGIARNGDLARLRLVAAYAQSNQRDKAVQLLSTLAGKREPVGLADLVWYWNLWLRRP